jgi:hypothetical protein
MKRTFVVAGFLTAAALASTADLNACGDKSLAAGGIRIQRALAARYPASILIYTPLASRLSGATRELKLQDTLRKVGHKYREVLTASELQASVDTGQFNIILADFADFTELQQKFESPSSRLVVVPVAYKLTKAETAEAAKQSRFLIKAPGREAQTLGTIVEAVRSRNGSPRKG